MRDRATANDLTREINAYQPGIGLDDEVSRTVYASAMLLLKPRKRVSLGYIVLQPHAAQSHGASVPFRPWRVCGEVQAVTFDIVLDYSEFSFHVFYKMAKAVVSSYL